MTGGGRSKVYTVLSSDNDTKVIKYKKSQFSIIHLVYAIFRHHKSDCAIEVVICKVWIKTLLGHARMAYGLPSSLFFLEK